MDPTRSREMPSCSAIDFAEILWSSKINSWIWSIISGLVTVLCRPGRGASQVEKSRRLKWATQFLTVAYEGACSPNICQNGVNFLRRLTLQEKKNLMTSRVSMSLKSRASPDMHPFSLCKKEKTCNLAHEQTPLSNDTFDSVLRHRELGQAKDLSATPRRLGILNPN